MSRMFTAGQAAAIREARDDYRWARKQGRREVLRHLAEYAEAVEDAVAANEDPFTEDNERRARGEFS